MKRLRTLKSFKIFKSERKKLKTYSGWCPFKGLSNDITLMQIQSGRTVPLILQNCKLQNDYFHIRNNPAANIETLLPSHIGKYKQELLSYISAKNNIWSSYRNVVKIKENGNRYILTSSQLTSSCSKQSLIIF